MTLAEQSLREAVATEALSWLGTPFVDQARLKGVGSDCAGLILEVYERAGVIPHVVAPHYSPEFMLHSREDRYLAELRPWVRDIEAGQVQRGDLVMFHFGRCFSHSAIVITYPTRLVHSCKGRGCEVFNLSADYVFHGRERKFYTARSWEAAR